jgi:ribonuclease J
MTHAHPEYSLPPELPKDGLRIVALGGLGEIGRNMTVFEFNGKLLIVDVGVLFPEENQPRAPQRYRGSHSHAWP